MMVVVQVLLCTFVLLLKAETCPPMIKTYCLEGRDGFNDVINGKYVYKGCNSNMPYFRNENSNEDVYIFFHDQDSILIGPDYTTTNGYAFCEQTSMEDCNKKFVVYDGSEWESGPDSSVYFGSDCDYARNTPSLCTDLTKLSISVAFDSEDLSGIYQVAGCYNSKPHLFKETSDGNMLYVYYDGNTEIYYISESFGDLSNVKATCDLNVYSSISRCLFVQSNIENDVILSFEVDDDGVPDYFLIIGLPLSGLFCIASLIVIIVTTKKVKSSLNNNAETQISNQKQSVDIEMEPKHNMDGATNIKETGMQSTTHSEFERKCTEESSQKKCTLKFVMKCIFVFLMKPGIEIYDYYTDITLSMIWLNGVYGFSDKCRLNYDKYAYPLLIASSLGFGIGFIGHIYSVFHSYFINKRLSYRSLSDLKQEKVNHFVLAKMLIEDVVAIIIFIIVSENEIGITDNWWWLTYYSSCAGLMLSAILLLRKHIGTMFNTSSKGKLLMVGMLVAIPFGLPLYASGKYESVHTLQLGFALNDNQCQIFEKEYSDSFSFKVEDNERYSIHCDAIFDSAGSSGFAYDKGYISGLYCNLYDSLDINLKVSCSFWMFEQECWSGECLPYSSDIQACFGYIGFE